MKNISISINNTKLANSIKKYKDLYKTRNIISVNARDAKKRTEIQFVITNDLSMFDMAVADVIYSLQKQGIFKITARKILVALSGDETISMPQDRKLQIEGIVDKLADTKLYISCPEEANNKILPYYEGRFIDVEKVKNGYRLQSEMHFPLYEYGEAKKHMITIPEELLQYRALEGREKQDRIINSNENILLKFYLIQQLEIIRNTKNYVDDKVFQFKNKKEIFEILDIDNSLLTDESAMNKIRDIYRRAELLLEYWKRIGYIKEYEMDKKEYSFYISKDMLCDDKTFKALKKKK